MPHPCCARMGYPPPTRLSMSRNAVVKRKPFLTMRMRQRFSKTKSPSPSAGAWVTKMSRSGPVATTTVASGVSASAPRTVARNPTSHANVIPIGLCAIALRGIGLFATVMAILSHYVCQPAVRSRCQVLANVWRPTRPAERTDVQTHAQLRPPKTTESKPRF